MNGEDSPDRNEDGTIVRKYGLVAGHYSPHVSL